MAGFEVESAKAGVNTANTIMWQLRSAVASRARIFELHLSVAGQPTTGPSWRLLRATALGATPTTVTPEEQDPGAGAPVTVLDTAWGTPPTVGTIGSRRYATPNAVGSGIVWNWPDHRPLILPANSGLVVVNVNAAGAALGIFNCTFVFQE